MEVMSLILSSTELPTYFLVKCAVGTSSIKSYSRSDAVILKINRSEFFPPSVGQISDVYSAKSIKVEPNESGTFNYEVSKGEHTEKAGGFSISFST